jgi:hypothetical protein
VDGAEPRARRELLAPATAPVTSFSSVKNRPVPGRTYFHPPRIRRLTTIGTSRHSASVRNTGEASSTLGKNATRAWVRRAISSCQGNSPQVSMPGTLL